MPQSRQTDLPQEDYVGDGDASSFQFTHLSFQEGLFAQALVDSSATEALNERFGGKHRELLGSSWFLNALTIGGSAVGATLKVDDAQLKLSAAELTALTATQWTPVGHREALELRLPEKIGSGWRAEKIEPSVRLKAVRQLATLLTSNTTLKQLE